MHYFHTSSTIGIGCLIFNLSVISYSAISQIDDEKVSAVNFIPSQFKFGGVLGTFGGFVFAFESVTSIFSIRADMKNPKDFKNIVLLVFSIAAISYLVFAQIGYIAYG